MAGSSLSQCLHDAAVVRSVAGTWARLGPSRPSLRTLPKLQRNKLFPQELRRLVLATMRESDNAATGRGGRAERQAGSWLPRASGLIQPCLKPTTPLDVSSLSQQTPSVPLAGVIWAVCHRWLGAREVLVPVYLVASRAGPAALWASSTPVATAGDPSLGISSGPAPSSWQALCRSRCGLPGHPSPGLTSHVSRRLASASTGCRRGPPVTRGRLSLSGPTPW